MTDINKKQHVNIKHLINSIQIQNTNYIFKIIYSDKSDDTYAI